MKHEIDFESILTEASCFESTYKLANIANKLIREGKQYILLLDEVVSLFTHMQGQLKPEMKKVNLESFELLIESCYKLIILDANLEYNLLR